MEEGPRKEGIADAGVEELKTPKLETELHNYQVGVDTRRYNTCPHRYYADKLRKSLLAKDEKHNEPTDEDAVQ